MKNLTPHEVAEKWSRKAQGATDDYVKGVRSVKEAPGLKAVKKQDKLKNNFNKAVDSGKWADATAAVSNEEWQSKAAGKGSERYAGGVLDAQPKMAAFTEEFIPFLHGHSKTIDAMPDATWEQRRAKMTANAEGIMKFKRTRRRR